MLPDLEIGLDYFIHVFDIFIMFLLQKPPYEVIYIIYLTIARTNPCCFTPNLMSVTVFLLSKNQNVAHNRGLFDT